MRDPYAVLGVRRNAGADEIKAAWRSMAKAVHPDQNRDDPQAAARFAEAGRAYEVLKDPRLRNRYDQARREADLRRMEEMKRRSEKAKAPEEPVDAETAEEAVSRIFSTGPARAKPGATAQRPQRVPESTPPEPKPAVPDTSAATAQAAESAAPAEAQGAGVAATLAKAAAPAAELVSLFLRRIRLNTPAARAGDTVPDLFCEVRVSIEDVFHRRRVTATLPDGQVLKVALLPGTTDGSTIRLKDQGYRLGTARGDVVVGVRVLSDERFRVAGLDVRTTLRVPLHDAVLGCQAKVATLSGTVPLTIPPWSSPDREFRLQGQGLPDVDGARGDLVVSLSLTLGATPDLKLTDLMRSQREGLVL